MPSVSLEYNTLNAIMVDPTLLTTLQTTLNVSPLHTEGETEIEGSNHFVEKVDEVGEQKPGMTPSESPAEDNIASSSSQAAVALIPENTQPVQMTSTETKTKTVEISREKATQKKVAPASSDDAQPMAMASTTATKKPVEKLDEGSHQDKGSSISASQAVETYQNSSAQQATSLAATQRSSDASADKEVLQRPQERLQVISRAEPNYPARALALQQEGKVEVKYDVNHDGRVVNMEILSAQPSNFFERDIKQAMRRWRYKPGHAGQGIVVTFYFRINGTTKIE